MIKAFAFAALFAAVADAACSNACSGHGTCGEEDLCKCFPRWTSPDCSTRECPYGPSWVAQPSNSGEKQIGPATGALGGRHGYTVCSSKGECNEDSGECECFTGYTGLACSRQSCPEDCSGHGRCITNLQADNAYTYKNKFVSEFWDADMTRLCTCDRGWQGYACSKRICPVGADPLTCDKEKNEPTVQRITLDNMDFPFASSTAFKIAITLRFKDMFNGEYTTQPIRLAGKTRGLENSVTVSGACGGPNGHFNAAHTDEATCLAATNCGPNTGASGAVAGALQCVWHKTILELRPCARSGVGTHSTCSQSGAWTALNQYDDTSGAPFVAGKGTALENYDANRIRYALESLPNFAIPSVNVTDVYPLGATSTKVDDIRYNTRWYFDVTFSHPANAGAQNLMGCTIASPATDNAAVSPRMGAPTIWEHTKEVDTCFSACGKVAVMVGVLGACAGGGQPKTQFVTMETCNAASVCGSGSNLQCVWTPTVTEQVSPTYQVNIASDTSSACSLKVTEGDCDGYCTWTADLTVTRKGHCAPQARACLRDDGNGKYICDGVIPGTTELSGATKVNFKNVVCASVVAATCVAAADVCVGTGGSPHANCAGYTTSATCTATSGESCSWGPHANCATHTAGAACIATAGESCSWGPSKDCNNGCYKTPQQCIGSNAHCKDYTTSANCLATSGESCSWQTTCAPKPDCPATDPTAIADTPGCPTAVSDLVQGVALAIKDPTAWYLNKAAFEASLADTCTGGTSDHGRCDMAGSAAACDGTCTWNVISNKCDGSYALAATGTCADVGGTNKPQYTTMTTCNAAVTCGSGSNLQCIWTPTGGHCNSVKTQTACIGTCSWKAAKAVVQQMLNVDQWWKSPVSVNPLSTMAHTLSGGNACSTGTRATCDGGCSWTRGDESGKTSTKMGCVSVTDAALCDKGCNWDNTADYKCKVNTWRCVSNAKITRTAPTCTVTHVKTASPANKHACSNRGVCDESTGLCGCFEGYAGEDCALQNIYF